MNCIIVIGLGSMGRRRIRLLQEIDPTIRIGGVDTQLSRRESVQKEYHIEVFPSIQEALSELRPFAGVVCSSPLSHRSIIMELLEHKLHVFTEINLVADGYNEMMDKAKEMGVTLFLSSTFLYRKDIQYIVKRAQNQPVNYCIHTGQYLPDWHPWEDYQTYFIGDRRTNACREILAIDLPWILKTFGEVEKLHVTSSKLSSLKIDYPDNYIINLTHKNGSNGVFFCDVISRCGGRRAEIINETIHLLWKGTPDSLLEYDVDTKKMKKVDTYMGHTQHLDAYSNVSIIEDAYKEELIAFLASLNGSDCAQYTFEDDKKTISLIDRIEAL